MTKYQLLFYFVVLYLHWIKIEAAVRISAGSRLSLFHGNSPRHVRYRRSTTSLSDIFGLTSDETFVIERKAKTVHGNILYKASEEYKGRNVFDTVVTMTTDEGIPVNAHGYFVQEITKDENTSQSSLSSDELFEILIQHFNDHFYRQNIGNRKLSREVFVDENVVARQVAVVEYLIETTDVQKRPTGVIDLKTGEVIHAWNNLASCRSYMKGKVFGGNYKIGKISYGVRPNCLVMKERLAMCYLENKFVRVVDMKNTEESYLTDTAKFYCYNRYPDRINGAYSPALDALHHGTTLGKMFRKWYGVKPWRRKMALRVHYSHHYNNAFWNGRNCTFGDGIPGQDYPFTSLDIVGHEVAHAITERYSRLMYAGESGAINEAFSDITGEMAEYYADTVDWRVGYAVKVRGVIRPFGAQGDEGSAITHVKDYKPWKNSHDTSGIFNRVFYLLANEYKLSPVDVYGVFLHANMMYWHPMTNFKTGACDVMMAAYDKGQPGEPYTRAFAEVGIGVCDVEDHVVYLRHNRTVRRISVSNTTKPIFAIELPKWARNVYARAGSKKGDIFIQLYFDPWNKINDTTPAFIQGKSIVRYTLPPYSGRRRFLLRLSTNTSKTLNDVRFKGGYSCMKHFHSYDRAIMKYYYWQCLGIDVDRVKH